jgi:hypothetical protein
MRNIACILYNVSDLDPDLNVLADPDPCRPKLSLLGWWLLRSLNIFWRGLRRYITFFIKLIRIQRELGSGSGFSNILLILIRDADPGYLSRIQLFSIPDPGPASKNLSILTPKNGF